MQTVYKTRKFNGEPSKSKELQTQGKGIRVPIPVWEGMKYSRIPPGQYTAVATRIVGPEYLKCYQRWSVGIAFCPLSEPDAEVVLFLNLGPECQPKRGSAYYRSWTIANGDTPMVGQAMDWAVFFEGQIYEIEVSDANMDSEGKQKCDAEVYSKAKRIVSASRGAPQSEGVIPIRGRRTK